MPTLPREALAENVKLNELSRILLDGSINGSAGARAIRVMTNPPNYVEEEWNYENRVYY